MNVENLTEEDFEIGDKFYNEHAKANAVVCYDLSGNKVFKYLDNGLKDCNTSAIIYMLTNKSHPFWNVIHRKNIDFTKIP